MNSRLLSISLCLNLVLLGVAGYRSVTSRSSSDTSLTKQSFKTPTREVASELAATSQPLAWSKIESENYAAYVANLRQAGCPGPVLRRIIRAELKELHAKKAFALAKDFHRDFWEIAARENVREQFKKTFGQQLRALKTECDALITQLIGEIGDEPFNSPADRVPESRVIDFLSPAKQEQLRLLTARYEALFQEVRQANLSSDEKTSELAALHRDMEKEQAQILSPEEWAEYQLRQSSAASDVQQLYGVDLSESELRNIAKTIDNYLRENQGQSAANSGTISETLDQKLQSLLGATRFEELNRARSASYRELHDIAAEFGHPVETATEIFNLRRAAETKSEEIRADKNRATEEKQALLDALYEQVDQAFATKFGAEAYQSYKARHGQWLNSVGRL